jgi:hypothetical protein
MRLVALGLVITVQVAAITAPFLHAHVDDHPNDHHHRAHEVHAHLAPHAPGHLPSTTTHVDGDEAERPLFLQVFLAVAAHAFDTPYVLSVSFEPPLPAERAARRPVHVVHGHDPPALTSISPRAPPPFLS